MQFFKTSALLAALLATAATAQATEFYGNIDIGVTSAKVNGQTVTKVDNNQSSASVYGVRDTEDLGNGLKVIMQLEGSFHPDDGTQGATNTPFNRDTFLGLTDGTNTFKLGRLKTLNRSALLEYDPFGSSAWGIGANTIDQNGNFAANSAEYDFSKFGATVSMMHTAGEVANGGIQSGSTDSASVRYATGPVSVTVAHTRVDSAAAVAASTTNSLVGASYTIGSVNTSVMYQKSDANKVNPIDSRVLLSATAPVASNVNVMAQVGEVKLSDDSKAKLAAIGGQYILSKRTNLYASLLRNEIKGQDGRSLTVGLRHRF